jgi:G3E family GTPase
LQTKKRKKILVTILTGFLGSGKTTLLSHLIKDSRMKRTAVVINEFGEIGLDHMLVEKADENTYVMDGGCICCTIRSGLGETLDDLFKKQVEGLLPEFDRVIVETTGLADPIPILRAFLTDEEILRNYQLQGVMTTVDANHGLEQLERHAECVKQVAVADRLVITKTDIANNKQTNNLLSRLQEINSGAITLNVYENPNALTVLLEDKNYETQFTNLDVNRWGNSLNIQELSKKEESRHDHSEHEIHKGIHTFCIVREKPLKWSNVVSFLEDIANRYSEELLRIKGIINVEESDSPVVIQGVHHYLYPYVHLEGWPDGDNSSRIVFIVQDLDHKVLTNSFNKFME